MPDFTVFLKTDTRVLQRPACRSAVGTDCAVGKAFARGDLPGVGERLQEIDRLLTLDDLSLLAALRDQQMVYFVAEHYNDHDRRQSAITNPDLQDLIEEADQNWGVFQNRFRLHNPEQRGKTCSALRRDLEKERETILRRRQEFVAYPTTTHLVVANRGEVACRIIEAAHSSGKKLIVLHDGKDLPYDGLLAEDDQIFHIPCFKDSSHSGLHRYDILSMHALAHFLKARGVDMNRVAVHPGWGFNAENDEWVGEVERLGFRMVGPHSSVISYLGTKTKAVEVALEAGLSTPQSSGKIVGRKFLDKDVDAEGEWKKVQLLVHEYFTAAREKNISLFLLKDALGGGGSGQLLFRDPEEADLIQGVREYWETYREFSVDQYLAATRHIEFQVLSDTAGNVRFGAPRDCTLQRARQKFNEETVDLPPTARRAMEEKITSFLELVRRKTGRPYTGAATFEFLFDPIKCEFYFMEVNTRLQVENCVSSAIDGIDYFQTQLDIADGRALLEQGALAAFADAGRRYAVQARICLERIVGEEERKTISKTLKVDMESVPVGGPGVWLTQFDLPRRTGIYLYEDDRIRKQIAFAGKTPVARGYDSMVAKIVAVGATAEEARAQLADAVSEMRIEGPGIHTNSDLILQSLAHAHRGDGLKLAERHLVGDVLSILRGKMELASAAAVDQSSASGVLHRLLLLIRAGAFTAEQWDRISRLACDLGAAGPFRGARSDVGDGADGWFMRIRRSLGLFKWGMSEIAIDPKYFDYFCAQVRHISGYEPADVIADFVGRREQSKRDVLDRAYVQAILHHENFCRNMLHEVHHANAVWWVVEHVGDDTPGIRSFVNVFSRFERLAQDHVRQDLWVPMEHFYQTLDLLGMPLEDSHREWAMPESLDERPGYRIHTPFLSDDSWKILQKNLNRFHVLRLSGCWYVLDSALPLLTEFLRREIGTDDLRPFIKTYALANSSDPAHCESVRVE
jgi:acetyl/propionyl-CoA carboxylase alpha subunit